MPGWVRALTGVAVVLFLCAVVLVLAAWLDGRQAEAEADRLSDQLRVLEHAYAQGGLARASLLRAGMRPTDSRCRMLYRATDASNQFGNTELEGRGESYFASGCLGRRPLTRVRLR